MPKSLDFHDMIVYDLLGRLPTITSRSAMSGWCIYADNIPIAFIIANKLHLKTKDPEIILELKKHESEQFSYSKKDGKVVMLNFWSVSDELLDHEIKLLELIQCVIDEQLQQR